MPRNSLAVAIAAMRHIRSAISLCAFTCAAFFIVSASALADSPSTQPAAILTDNLSEMHNLKTISADFICQKQLAVLNDALISRGHIWIQRPDRIRFSTTDPYVSELILRGGAVLAKSQHEAQWITEKTSRRPGLNNVMAQLAAWSLGESRGLADQYVVTAPNDPLPAAPHFAVAAAAMRAPPSTVSIPAATMPTATMAATMPTNAGLVAFQLTPRDAQLAKAVQSIVLGLDADQHFLRYLAVTTTQGDVTRYWFFNQKINESVPADIFTPTGVRP